MLHGADAAQECERTARATFENGAVDLGLPTTMVSMDDLNAGIGLTAALEMSGLAASKGEAKRKIAEGAVRVNDAVVEDANAVLKSANLTDQQLIKLSLGKKRHALLRVGN